MFKKNDVITVVYTGHSKSVAVARLLFARGYDVIFFIITGEDSIHSRMACAQLSAQGCTVLEGDIALLNATACDVFITDFKNNYISHEAIGPKLTKSRFVLLADAFRTLIRGHRNIAIVGTHGRRTVAAMVAWIIECAGWLPGFMIDGLLTNFDQDTRDSSPEHGGWFVFDLGFDELEWADLPVDYVGCSFLDIRADKRPDLLVQVQSFLESNRGLKEVFVNLDCQGNRRLVHDLALRPTGYSLHKRTEYRGNVHDRQKQTSRLLASHRDRELFDIQIPQPGSYNGVNALGSVAIARRLGIDDDTIQTALHSFLGIKHYYRESRAAGVVFVKDWSMEAGGIQTALETTREEHTGNGLIYSVLGSQVFELLVNNYEVYAPALVSSDKVLLMDTQSVPQSKKRALFSDLLNDYGVLPILLENEGKLYQYLEKSLREGDRVVFLGDHELMTMGNIAQARLVQASEETAGAVEQPRMDGPLVDDE